MKVDFLAEKSLPNCGFEFVEVGKINGYGKKILQRNISCIQYAWNQCDAFPGQGFSTGWGLHEGQLTASSNTSPSGGNFTVSGIQNESVL